MPKVPRLPLPPPTPPPTPPPNPPAANQYPFPPPPLFYVAFLNRYASLFALALAVHILYHHLADGLAYSALVKQFALDVWQTAMQCTDSWTKFHGVEDDFCKHRGLSGRYYLTITIFWAVILLGCATQYANITRKFCMPVDDQVDNEWGLDFYHNLESIKLTIERDGRDGYYPSSDPALRRICLFAYVCIVIVYFCLFSDDKAVYKRLKMLFILFFYINFNKQKTHILSHLFKEHKAVILFFAVVEFQWKLDSDILILIRSLIFVLETGKMQKGRIHLAVVVLYATARFIADAAREALPLMFLTLIATIFQTLNYLADNALKKTRSNLNKRGQPPAYEGDNCVVIEHVKWWYNTVFWLEGFNCLCETCFLAELVLFCY